MFVWIHVNGGGIEFACSHFGFCLCTCAQGFMKARGWYQVSSSMCLDPALSVLGLHVYTTSPRFKQNKTVYLAHARGELANVYCIWLWGFSLQRCALGLILGQPQYPWTSLSLDSVLTGKDSTHNCLWCGEAQLTAGLSFSCPAQCQFTYITSETPSNICSSPLGRLQTSHNPCISTLWSKCHCHLCLM